MGIFETQLRKNFGQTTAESQVWLDYALGTNDRGEKLISMLEESFVGSFAGKRVLDLGCGFGGTSLSAAKRGAEVIGLEYDASILDLGKLNAADHSGIDVRLLQGDAMDLALLNEFGQFDVIICDNVIEHVPDAHRLIYSIGSLLKPDGISYITAPNGRATGMVQSDCHYQIFGISLLNRFDAQRHFNDLGWKGPYCVGDYFDDAQYKQMFLNNGLVHQQLVPTNGTPEYMAGIESKIHEIQEAAARSPDHLREVISHYVGGFLARVAEMEAAVDERRAVSLGHAIDRDYGISLWYYIVRKQG